MKKLFSLALAAALLLTLAACGKPYTPLPNPALVLGEKYLTDLDYEQALLQFDQAIEIEPKNPRGYLGKADALLHLERQDDAVQALNTGAKAATGDTRSALKTAQTEVAKSLVDGYIGLSAAYEKLGWKEIAVALIQRVCEELPEESRLRAVLERLVGVAENTTPANDTERWEKAYAQELDKERELAAEIQSGDPDVLDTYYNIHTTSDYAFEDIDKNGIAELILKDHDVVYRICTLVDNQPVELEWAGAGNQSLSIDQSGAIIGTQGNGTSLHLYWARIRNGAESLVEQRLDRETNFSGDNQIYTHNDEVITQEQYEVLLTTFKSSREEDSYTFHPILDYEPVGAEPSDTPLSKDLLADMPIAAYRALNQFFDHFSWYGTPLKDIKTDRDVLASAVYYYQDGNENFSVPKEKVEAAARRYFGVEKINHAAVGDHGADIPSYRGGYYNSGTGVGGPDFRWSNVSELTDNGDGTMTAVVSWYSFLDDSDWMSESPANPYDPMGQWSLTSAQRDAIHKYSTDTVVLRRFVYEGENTWQIVSVNGWDIPKNLY